jgi:hypothetical protein
MDNCCYSLFLKKLSAALLLLSVLLCSTDVLSEGCTDCKLEATRNCRDKCDQYTGTESLLCNKKCMRYKCDEECFIIGSDILLEDDLNPEKTQSCRECLEDQKDSCFEQCAEHPLPNSKPDSCKNLCLKQKCKEDCSKEEPLSEFELPPRSEPTAGVKDSEDNIFEMNSGVGSIFEEEEEVKP